MKARLVHSKRQGQSIIIIALIIVVLVGMVGLSVDVGNTYAQNRNAVRATNAAALAAMDKLIRNGSDPDIGNVIVASFKSNGITAQINPAIAPQPGERQIQARYLDSNGNWLSHCYIGNCGSVPTNVSYIQINTTGLVDTYFARVLGQKTLPVNAQAFAAQCSPVLGVYPIAINLADLDKNGFKMPTDPKEMSYYGTYSDSVYQNKTQRRIFRKPNFGDPGSFSWLMWKKDNSNSSAVSTADMLALDGNLDLGFQEVNPWPDPSVTADAGYPLYPGQLTDGDWIYGNTGNTNSNAVRDALDYHIKYRTIMNLPIVDRSVGGGQNTAYHFDHMGSFILRDYDRSGLSWFDFVYVGQANNKACLNTNVNQGLKGLGLAGLVYVNPRWKLTQPPSQPVAYNIVLDVSGSMSWDFNGYGTYDGSNHDNSGYYTSNPGIKGDVQCEAVDNPNPLNLKFTDRCIGGKNSAWHNENERRIYVAKNAIFNFINRMNSYDMMRVVAFSSSQNGNATASTKWSSDKTELTNYVKCAGAFPAYSTCPPGSFDAAVYKTSGGTPGADALQKARQMFLASNGYTPTASNGQSFKPVVIYITDGAANYYLGGDQPNYARDICSNMSMAEASNTADPCQIGTNAGGQLRPISAMIDVANKMKASMQGLEIYVIGLAQVPQAGLPKVANDAGYFYSATQKDAVEGILKTIQNRVANETCTAGGGFNWMNFIPSSNTPASPPAPGNGVYGYVNIFDVNGGTPKYTLPIQHDTSASSTGRLGFTIPPPDPSNPASTGITPGTYEMEAWISYKAEDGTTRIYDYFINQSTLRESHRVTFSVSSAATLGSSVALDPIFLDLQSTTHVCPATP